MENDEKVDPNFLKGFNEGYLMALYLPETADKLINMSDENPRNAGFKAGRDQLLAEREVNKNILPPWLRNLYDRDQPSIELSPDKEKDRDVEPDKD